MTPQPPPASGENAAAVSAETAALSRAARRARRDKSRVEQLAKEAAGHLSAASSAHSSHHSDSGSQASPEKKKPKAKKSKTDKSKKSKSHGKRCISDEFVDSADDHSSDDENNRERHPGKKVTPEVPSQPIEPTSQPPSPDAGTPVPQGQPPSEHVSTATTALSSALVAHASLPGTEDTDARPSALLSLASVSAHELPMVTGAQLPSPLSAATVAEAQPPTPQQEAASNRDTENERPADFLPPADDSGQPPDDEADEKDRPSTIPKHPAVADSAEWHSASNSSASDAGEEPASEETACAVVQPPSVAFVVPPFLPPTHTSAFAKYSEGLAKLQFQHLDDSARSLLSSQPATSIFPFTVTSLRELQSLNHLLPDFLPLISRIRVLLYLQLPGAATFSCAHSKRFFGRREESELNLLRQVAARLNDTNPNPDERIAESDVHNRVYDFTRPGRRTGANLRDFLWQLVNNVPAAAPLLYTADAFEGDPYTSLEVPGAARARLLLHLLDEYSTTFYGEPLGFVGVDFPRDSRVFGFWQSYHRLSSSFQLPELFSLLADPICVALVPPSQLEPFPAPSRPDVALRDGRAARESHLVLHHLSTTSESRPTDPPSARASALVPPRTRRHLRREARAGADWKTPPVHRRHVPPDPSVEIVVRSFLRHPPGSKGSRP